MNYKVEGLNNLANQFHKFQFDAGFTDSSITQRLMLVHSEISEAFEAFRKDRYAVNLRNFENNIVGLDYTHNTDIAYFKQEFEVAVKDTFEDEMADSIIRLLAMCAENNIDVEKHIQLKMKYNEFRGFKFGGKKF